MRWLAVVLALACALAMLVACGDATPALTPLPRATQIAELTEVAGRLAATAAAPTPTAARPAAPTREPATAPPRGDRVGPPATRTATSTREPAAGGLPTIAFAQLPPEAQETIRLIDRGGPFPYSRDGITFYNREGLLPKEPDGYYHEYTVVTPGSADRGARRIVAGRDGALYYSADHYASFKRVVR
ncbi:MAG TPA: ribonuclease domain-containing protein [Thermomicrobiales bacterium]|nr:ribonuclease domain-containing protein [Thermomicrobiales bacterium]